MRIGGEYRVEAITRRHWERFCAANGLDEAGTVARIAELAERLPDCFVQAAKAKPVRDLRSRLPGRLADRMAQRVAQCRQALL
jgi:serine/threonine-protein kinase HipA